MVDDDVIIIPYQDGPYLIRGPAVLRDQDGRSIAVSRRTIALCRCGKSRTRPFCDGTHHIINFRAGSSAEPRVPAPDELRGRDADSVAEPDET
jgi:CDGSH-type Zn-finger protein